MRYVKKTVETPYGVDAECWMVDTITIAAMTATGAQPAQVVLKPWVDAATYTAGKASIPAPLTVNIEDISQLADYETLVGIVIGAVLSNAQFVGGTIEDTETA